MGGCWIYRLRNFSIWTVVLIVWLGGGFVEAGRYNVYLHYFVRRKMLMVAVELDGRWE